MGRIDFGLKIFSNNAGAIDEINRLYDNKTAQYAEIYYLFGTEIKQFKRCNAPIVLHCDHGLKGLNIGEKKKKNKGMIELLIKAIDELDARCAIVHAGFGDKSVAQEFLESIDERRIIIENMPKLGINGEKMIGFDKEGLEFITKRKFSTCLDFSHAARAALSLKKDYVSLVNELLELNPRIFHLSDADFNSEKDNHLKLGEGELDMGFIKNCIEKNDSSMVTLEIPKKEKDSFNEEIESIEFLKKIR